MKATEYIDRSVYELHRVMIDDVKGLTQQQAQWRPAPKANPINFLVWHFMRTEDNIVQNLQGKPTIWESGNWHQKLGMDKLGIDTKVQGTGFQEPDVDKVATLPITELVAYADQVIQSTTNYMKTLDDAKLDYAADPQRPQRTVGALFRQIIVGHGWWHLGEIKYLKGLQGISAGR